MSLPLLKQTIRSNWSIWTVMTGVMSLLGVQFSAMDMTKPMLFSIFYGMMTTILPGIYILVTSNKLIASQVDRGSMAYVLSTPTKRSAVSVTQGVFLTASVALMFAASTAAHIIVNSINETPIALFGYPSVSGDLTNPMILKINLSALMVCIAMAGICFSLSSIFNTSKHTMAFSGSFLGVMILANMLSMFGKLGAASQLEKMKYLTLCSFYEYESVLFGNSDWIVKMVFPLVIAIAGFVAGGAVFKRKDLPL